MCRLALMNKTTAELFASDLSAFFAMLEQALGGHGNGVAALWCETGKVRIRKGVNLTAAAAAQQALKYVKQGADWVLFHTRLATCGSRTSKNCHPFKMGQLVLAHNGHDYTFSNLGETIGLSDSGTIAQIFGRLQLPLIGLEEVDGVFVGFHHGEPFVVKGDTYDDLTVGFDRDTGAVLFASVLPDLFAFYFTNVVTAGRFTWISESLDMANIPPRPPKRPLTSYVSSFTSPSTVSAHQPLGGAPSTPPSSSFTLATMREHYQRAEEEDGRTVSAPAESFTDTGAVASLWKQNDSK